jgi:PD-(D/E)XK nuclease superfamily
MAPQLHVFCQGRLHMHLFDQVVIREQEVFACRVLTYLMQRSPELRDGTVSAINRCKGMDAHYFQTRNTFSVVTEWTTDATASGDGPGRVDLLLEIDNAVIGIEAKLNADLAEDQPKKYLDAISDHARRLTEIRGVAMTPVCVLLGPESMAKYFSDHLARHPSHPSATVCILTWTELFEAWRDSRATDPVALFVADEIENFILTQTGRRADFSHLYARLAASLAKAEHDSHVDFLWWIRPAFRSNDMPYLRVSTSASRTRTERTYVGYYFAGSMDRVWGWYGFVEPKAVAEPADGRPALVVGTDFDVPDLDPAVFKPVNMRLPGWPDGTRWWRINFNRDWNDLTTWQQALAPLREALRRESLSRMAKEP